VARQDPSNTPQRDPSDREAVEYVARATQRGAALDQLSTLSAWQRRMERYPQLGASEQNALVAQFQAGRAAQTQLDTGKRLSASRERSLRAEVRRGAQAMEMLTGANFRLLYLIAREKAEERYGRERASRILPDLIGETNVALIEAAGVYDASKGPSFPTYLAKVARDRVLATLSKQHAVKSPPSWTRVKRIYTVRFAKLTETLGRPPTLDEMKADLLRVCLEWAEERLTAEQRRRPKAEREEAMMERLRKQGMLGAISKLEDVLAATQNTGSFDAPVGDGDGTLGDIIGDGQDAVGTQLEQAEMQQAVQAVLAGLEPREREIIMYRYGFMDGETWTYAKISERYNVSPERIRQIERATVSKLRLPHDQYRKLAGYIEEPPEWN
jgi:RNA polymerase sigma factor (sigma-70 family)